MNTVYALASEMSIPWLVGGHFNVIVDEEENFGGRHVSMNEVEVVRHCINTCNLTYLGFKVAYTLGGIVRLMMTVFSRGSIDV